MMTRQNLQEQNNIERHGGHHAHPPYQNTRQLKKQPKTITRTTAKAQDLDQIRYTVPNEVNNLITHPRPNNHTRRASPHHVHNRIQLRNHNNTKDTPRNPKQKEHATHPISTNNIPTQTYPQSCTICPLPPAHDRNIQHHTTINTMHTTPTPTTPTPPTLPTNDIPTNTHRSRL